jgi:hypothetical protein
VGAARRRGRGTRSGRASVARVALLSGTLSNPGVGYRRSCPCLLTISRQACHACPPTRYQPVSLFDQGRQGGLLLNDLVERKPAALLSPDVREGQNCGSGIALSPCIFHLRPGIRAVEWAPPAFYGISTPPWGLLPCPAGSLHTANSPRGCQTRV